MTEITRDKEAQHSAEDLVHVSFSAELYQMLEEIAQKREKSVTDIIEEAIGLEKWYVKAREEGGRVIVEHPNGNKWELVRD
jgi:hypothetical protein